MRFHHWWPETKDPTPLSGEDTATHAKQIPVLVQLYTIRAFMTLYQFRFRSSSDTIRTTDERERETAREESRCVVRLHAGSAHQVHGTTACVPIGWGCSTEGSANPVSCGRSDDNSTPEEGKRATAQPNEVIAWITPDSRVNQPCRCLWRGCFLQTTKTRPLR